MPALTAALLAAGAILAAFGLAGFALNWHVAADRADLAVARTIATAGQWATTFGLLTLWTGGYRVGGIAQAAVDLTVCAATLSVLTKAPLRHLAPG